MPNSTAGLPLGDRLVSIISGRQYTVKREPHDRCRRVVAVGALARHADTVVAHRKKPVPQRFQPWIPMPATTRRYLAPAHGACTHPPGRVQFDRLGGRGTRRPIRIKPPVSLAFTGA